MTTNHRSGEIGTREIAEDHGHQSGDLREDVIAKSNSYVENVQSRLLALRPAGIADRVTELAQHHETWRGRCCLNMNPAEGLMSRRSRRMLDNDMATRLTEGLPGAKTFPHYRQTAFIDEIEAIIISLVRRQFGARFVEWRPVSTTMANAVVFFSLLREGDTILVQSMRGGGNFAYHKSGPAGLTGARVAIIPPTGSTFEVDVEEVAAQASRLKPKVIVIGGGKVLFPYPVQAIRRIADSIGATLVYDAAHLGLLISAGDFQRPLAEGAHVVTLSTHKIMGGPVGGLILTDDHRLAARIGQMTFPGFLQTRDQNKYAALAITLAELEEHGQHLARRMVSNAKALAGSLEAEGFTVINHRGVHTETHQVLLNLGTNSASFEQRCQKANILIPDCALTGDEGAARSGARLGTHEVSKRGMAEPEMREIASLIGRASRDSKDDSSSKIASEVRTLMARFPTVPFSFDHAGLLL